MSRKWYYSFWVGGLRPPGPPPSLPPPPPPPPPPHPAGLFPCSPPGPGWPVDPILDSVLVSDVFLLKSSPGHWFGDQDIFCLIFLNFNTVLLASCSPALSRVFALMFCVLHIYNGIVIARLKKQSIVILKLCARIYTFVRPKSCSFFLLFLCVI